MYSQRQNKYSVSLEECTVIESINIASLPLFFQRNYCCYSHANGGMEIKVFFTTLNLGCMENIFFFLYEQGINREIVVLYVCCTKGLYRPLAIPKVVVSGAASEGRPATT